MKKQKKKVRSVFKIVLDLLAAELITKEEALTLLNQNSDPVRSFSGWCTTSTHNVNICYENN